MDYFSFPKNPAGAGRPSCAGEAARACAQTFSTDLIDIVWIFSAVGLGSG